MIIEPFRPFVACEFRLKVVTLPWEKNRAAALRREVFCREQGIFKDDDRDAIDEVALPLVALSSLAITHEDVVGTVRIHEAEPGLWWGSRLAVARPYRKIGAIGTSPRCFTRCTGKLSKRSLCMAIPTISCRPTLLSIHL
jgi:putative N-acetyltransferase (TIGR04045 family)